MQNVLQRTRPRGAARAVCRKPCSQLHTVPCNSVGGARATSQLRKRRPRTRNACARSMSEDNRFVLPAGGDDADWADVDNGVDADVQLDRQADGGEGSGAGVKPKVNKALSEKKLEKLKADYERRGACIFPTLVDVPLVTAPAAVRKGRAAVEAGSRKLQSPDSAVHSAMRTCGINAACVCSQCLHRGCGRVLDAFAQASCISAECHPS